MQQSTTLSIHEQIEGSQEMFAGAFTGEWKPVYRSAAYRLALSISAVFMIVVIVAFIAAIAGLGWLLYWHTTENTWMVTQGLGDSKRLGLLAYSAGGVFGLVLLIFLVYPVVWLFAPKPPPPDVSEIYAGEEPRLFAFVEMVCAKMNAPAPRRIFITGEANASAEMMGGLLGLFGPSRLGLHIGLPLVAGMDATSFAAVLAHEFGHFSQGAGMRATALLHRMSYWMLQAAYRPGGADAIIGGMLKPNSPAVFKMVGFLLNAAIWVVRLILKIVLIAGFAIAQAMSRRMEFDADAHAARFVGSAAAQAVWPKVYALGLASGEVDQMMAEHWKNKRLPEDLPMLIASFSKRLSPDARSSIKQMMEDKRTGWFESHPATGRRMAYIDSLREPGIFRLDEPARSLFTNFDETSKRASYNHFKERVGDEIFTATFVPAETIFAGLKQEEERSGLCLKYLGFEPAEWRPLVLGMKELTPSSDPQKSWARVKEARATLSQSAGAARAAVDEFVKADKALLDAAASPAAFDLGIGKIDDGLGFEERTRPRVGAAAAKAQPALMASAAAMDVALDAGAARVGACLRLLASRGIESRLPGAAPLRERAAVLVTAHAALANAFMEMKQLREESRRLLVYCYYSDHPKHKESVKEPLRALSDTVRDRLASLRADLGAVSSAFDGVDGVPTNLGEAVVRDSPGWREYGHICETAMGAVSRYAVVNRRTTLELIEIAAKVEAGLTKAANRSAQGEAKASQTA
ncbi:MAG: M48 family metalloprotease [Phycisphaeraceae bacterium]|nr:M48 family metalloprotease [Phycisphaeraceae bacterium]